MNKFNLAIIGSSRIAEIHYKFLNKYNFCKIYFVGRKKEKIISFLKKHKIKDTKTLTKKNFNKKNFNIISLCNNSNFHQDYLDIIKYNPNLLIIEKPIISIQVFKKKYKSYLKKIYKKFSSVIVIYPMVFLARSIYNFINIKDKINSLELHYYTSGPQTYEENFLDLSPHALTFFYEICKLKKIKLNKINKIEKDVKEKRWKGTIYFENIKLLINFKKIPKNHKSKFFVKINNFNIERLIRKKDNTFINYLKFNKKIIEIINPMESVFENAIHALKKKKFLIENKKLTKWLMNLTCKIYEQNN